jgi:RNA polymerase sigma-70 factor (sigma-E family)
VDRKQERAFEEFVAGSGDALLRLAMLLTSDRGLGEDACQETLHRLAARWSKVTNPDAYARRILHNVVIDQARARERRPAQVELEQARDDGDPRAQDRVAAVEVRPVLLAALRALAPQQRAVVVLRYFDDRSESEIADLLGIAPGTVKATASRAMALLRQQPGISGLLTATDPDPATDPGPVLGASPATGTSPVTAAGAAAGLNAATDTSAVLDTDKERVRHA